MKTIGQILKTQRKTKGLTVSELADKTKIRPDYIKAIEADKFQQLPSATFVKGFIRNLALALELEADTALAVFRRDFDQDKAGKVVPRGLSEPLRTPSRLYNPKTLTWSAVILTVVVISVYFVIQYVNLTQAPLINLTSPAEDVISSNIVKVAGSTSSDATVMVNQKPVSLNLAGQFETTLDLSPGEHTLVIEAKSRDGKIRILERRIRVAEN